MTVTDQELREVTILRTFIATGSYAATAEETGITREAVKSALNRMRRRYGVRGDTIGVLPVLAQRGLLSMEWLV